jgi:hypothetical protein
LRTCTDCEGCLDGNKLCLSSCIGCRHVRAAVDTLIAQNTQRNRDIEAFTGSGRYPPADLGSVEIERREIQGALEEASDRIKELDSLLRNCRAEYFPSPHLTFNKNCMCVPCQVNRALVRS